MKALIALYENETLFDFRILDSDHPENGAELVRVWPVARFPLLVDGGTTVFETSAMIEHLAAFHAGPVPLIPADARAAVPVRMLDRVFDSRVMGPMQAVVFERAAPKKLAIRMASRRPEPHSIRSMPGLTMPWRGANGQPAMLLRSLTQPPRLRCSAPTGCTRSATIVPRSRPIAHAWSRVPLLPAASTPPVPIGRSFRSAPPIGTDIKENDHDQRKPRTLRYPSDRRTR